MAWRFRGQYLKNCSCKAFCTCDADGDPAPNDFCEGVIAWHVDEGEFEGTSLNGLNFAASFHFPGPLYAGNGRAEAFIDERANEAQRNAIVSILSGQAGGAWFEVVASLLTDFIGVQFVPFDWEFDLKRRHAHVRVPGQFEMTNSPIKIRPTEDELHMQVRLPNGMEYKEMEVAQVTMRSSGAIKFDWKNTSGGMAQVVHTDKGLVA
jgi:hypothetical protein